MVKQAKNLNRSLNILIFLRNQFVVIWGVDVAVRRVFEFIRKIFVGIDSERAIVNVYDKLHV